MIDFSIFNLDEDEVGGIIGGNIHIYGWVVMNIYCKISNTAQLLKDWKKSSVKISDGYLDEGSGLTLCGLKINKNVIMVED